MGVTAARCNLLGGSVPHSLGGYSNGLRGSAAGNLSLYGGLMARSAVDFAGLNRVRDDAPMPRTHRTLCKKLSQTCTKLSSSSRPMGTEMFPTTLLPT